MRRMIMPRYLLSTHSVEGEQREPMTDEQMRATYQRLTAIEEEMNASGAWVFSARLHGPDTATVVRVAGGEVLTTDGPFVESKEHLAGFYIVDAEDLDAGLSWRARRPASMARWSAGYSARSRAAPWPR